MWIPCLRRQKITALRLFFSVHLLTSVPISWDVLDSVTLPVVNGSAVLLIVFRKNVTSDSCHQMYIVLHYLCHSRQDIQGICIES
jgi:hypothetical protein